MASKRDKILHGARVHYREVGAKQFTMRGAASESGVSASALYYHFDDRAELLSEIVRIGLVRLLEALRTATDAPTAGARLRESCRVYVRFALEYPRDYEALFLDEAVPVEGVAGNMADGERPTYRFVVEEVKECMEVGHLRSRDPHEVSLLIWSAIHGLCSLQLGGHFEDEQTFREIADREIELLLGALRP